MRVQDVTIEASRVDDDVVRFLPFCLPTRSSLSRLSFS